MKKKERKWIEWMARFGLAGRGFVYLLVAFIAIQVPFGKPTSADKEGALASLSSRPWGKPVLLAIAIGFAGYAVWRLVEAVLDPEGKSRKSSGKWKRVGYLFRGGLYTVFAYNALRVAITAQSEGSTQKAQEATAGVLGLPFGKWVVVAFGAGLMVAGAYNAFRFVSGRFRKDMKEGEMSPAQRRALVPIAAIGLGARALCFLLIGGFFINAGLTFNPSKAIGLDGALRKIAASPGGPVLLTAVAGGLAAFGLFSLAQARFREVMNS